MRFMRLPSATSFSYGSHSVLILSNPSATADIQEKLLATNREILNHYRFIKAFAFHLHA